MSLSAESFTDSVYTTGGRSRSARTGRRATVPVTARSETHEERVPAPLRADRRHRPVARDDAGLVVEREQPVADRAQDPLVVSAPEVGAPDAAGEERVPRE